MKKYLILLCVILLATIAFQRKALENAKSERDRYKSNTEALLTDVQRYKTSDSLNAAKVGALELKNKEFKKHFAEDEELIKTLQTKNRELSQYIGTGTTTEVHIVTEVHDTTIVHDSIPYEAQKFHYSDPWVDLHGTIYDEEMDCDLSVRDSLVIVETIKRKRFLGFLWKTRKIENRQWDVVSRCPYTKIDKFEVVSIKK